MASPQRLWWMELVRGIIAIAFGLLFLAARSFAPSLLIYSLGAYLTMDGLLELYGVHKRKIASSHRVSVLDSVGGVVSLLIGLLCLFFPHITLLVLTSVIALSIIVNGVSQMRMVRRVHEGSLVFRRASDSLRVLLGLFLLFFPSLVMTFFVLFLGSYMLVAGIALLLRGFSLRFLSRHLPPVVSLQTTVSPSLKNDLAISHRCALVFIRRTGANGLGHIGWGFAWKNGWFSVGAVENTGSRPFANPEDMGFWCLQTLDPVATMRQRERSYDEYKLFFVSQSHSEDAWKMQIWESQEPYSFVHHNCCDVVYEILQAYGCTGMLDPAQEYIPNDWYDALPGTSYPLAEDSALQVSLDQWSQREITAVIPSCVKRSSPSWRLRLRRPWEELILILEMMLGHLRTLLLSGFKLIAQRLHRSASRP